VKSAIAWSFSLLCAYSATVHAQSYQGQLSTNPYAFPQYQPPTAPTYSPPPVLYDQQGQYRGNMSSNPYDADSINNPYGRYGNPYSADSINNPYGAGNPYASDSPTNPYGQGWSVYSR